jgi:predicted DNA binding protein
VIILTKTKKNTKKNIYIIKGDDESIKNFFKAVDIFTTIQDIKIQKLEYKDCDILSNLTSNQKKILNLAKKLGYYDYPRKITHQELSEKIGINKDTILELLRKAEKTIFSKIFNDNNT